MANKKHDLMLVAIYVLMVSITFGFGLALAFTMAFIAVMAIYCTVMMTNKILIPNLLLNRKKKRYIFYYLFCSLIFMTLLTVACRYAELLLSKLFNITTVYYMHDAKEFRYFNLIWITYLICNVIAFRRKMQEDSGQNEILSIEKKEMEMKTLKSQINTHFLHNALNNIYSMIYFGNKDEAAKYVMKFSQMLRYVLDDCEADSISIDKKIAYIENYIDFQKARFDTDKDICFNHIQRSTEMIYLPPMIFQPLIENCFKYCPLNKADSYVHIDLEVDNSQIRFVCENTKNTIDPISEKEGNGIGIKNLDKRLYISYGENYKLNISDKETVFRVELIINL